MKLLILTCLFGLAICRPQQVGDRVVKILRDDRVQPAEGKYSFDIETEDGITRSESGSPLNMENNPTGQQGTISFTFPSGEEFKLSFVANEGGYQPESSWIPIAPEFPHPIPQFVLDQIEKAAREDAEIEKNSNKINKI